MIIVNNKLKNLVISIFHNLTISDTPTRRTVLGGVLLGFCCLSNLAVANTSVVATATASITVSNSADMGTIDDGYILSEGGGFMWTRVIPRISVSDASSYNLSFSAMTEETDLVNATDSDRIDSISSGMLGNNLPPKTWGFMLPSEEGATWSIVDSTLYPIPSVSNPYTLLVGSLTRVDDYSIDIYTPIVFTAKVNRHASPGTYAATILFSLTAEDAPSEPTDLASITYMQDMTTDICEATATPTKDSPVDQVATKQLIDKRDSKKYWVAKLADGHCWMTQNLALDLSTSIALTPDDTDVSSNWTPTNDTTDIANTGDRNAASIQSWSWGDYIINAPNTGTNLCPSLVANLQSCSGFASLTNVGGGTGYTDDYEAAGSDTDIVAVDTANKKYDAHYLLGNYYTWNAATAGTSRNIANTNAKSSICPKGWHLPTSNSAKPGSFAYLLNTTYDKTDGQAINSAPLYFSYSGYVWPSSSYGLYYVGHDGRYWSRTAGSNTNFVYPLYFTSSSLYPSYYYNRYYGFSVRCML